MRLAMVGWLGLALAGCTSAGWDHSFAFLDSPKPAAPAPSLPGPPDPHWCDEAAAKAEAADQGFDAATQAHRAETIYAQCRRSR